MAVTVTVTVKLRRAVRAHGTAIDALTFREPTGEDITVCGYPLQISDGAATPISGAITKYISRLADVPPSTVRGLSAPDYSACLHVVLGFFEGSEEERTPVPVEPD